MTQPGPHRSAARGRYVIVWEFHVKPGAESRFAEVYGPDGDWARFFRRGEGYVRTELLRDEQTPGRYVTLDYWNSRTAYEHFREQCADDYMRLDDNRESLTEREAQLSSYLCVGS